MKTNHVVSLEIAKQLKEVGWKKDTMFWWCNGATTHLFTTPTHLHFSECKADHFPAPLATEILEELPDWWGENEAGIIIFKDCGTWFVQCKKNMLDKPIVDFNDDNLCNALAKMWLYLKKNKL